MSDELQNVYADATRAEAYSGLEFPGTYFLAFRDLPGLIARHARGRRALDFGCGAGRSSRFLRGLGFDVVGVDVAPAMLERARAADPRGDYRLVGDGDLSALGSAAFDLVLCAFPFDNIPSRERKVRILRALRDRLDEGGRIVNLVSAPEIYRHEWVSFSTRDFPENRAARSGDRVRIVMLDVPDRRPVEDILCSEESYREAYAAAGLSVHEVHRPLGRADEGRGWVTETEVSPWAIHVLAPPPGETQPGETQPEEIQPGEPGSGTPEPGPRQAPAGPPARSAPRRW